MLSAGHRRWLHSNPDCSLSPVLKKNQHFLQLHISKMEMALGQPRFPAPKCGSFAGSLHSYPLGQGSSLFRPAPPSCLLHVRPEVGIRQPPHSCSVELGQEQGLCLCVGMLSRLGIWVAWCELGEPQTVLAVDLIYSFIKKYLLRITGCHNPKLPRFGGLKRAANSLLLLPCKDTVYFLSS